MCTPRPWLLRLCPKWNHGEAPDRAGVPWLPIRWMGEGLGEAGRVYFFFLLIREV